MRRHEKAHKRPAVQEDETDTHLEDEDARCQNVQKRKKAGKRATDKPLECSSKLHVPKHRIIIGSERPKPSDPRFEKAFGEFNKQRFDKEYAFLEEIRKSEIGQLERAAREDATAKTIMKKMKNEEKAKQRAKKLEQAKKEHYELEREMVKMGKRPFYLRKSKAYLLVLDSCTLRFREGALWIFFVLALGFAAFVPRTTSRGTSRCSHLLENRLRFV